MDIKKEAEAEVLTLPKRKRRFGDRKDGRKLRTLDPLNSVSPYIMKRRSNAENLVIDSFDTEMLDSYIASKRAAGLKGFGVLHVFIAAYVRTISQLPGINRFISGQKIYARNDIVINLSIKKELALNATETIIKIHPPHGATAEDIYWLMVKLIEENKNAASESNFDNTAKIFNYIPGLLLKFSVFTLQCLDYFGKLPRKLTNVSPFHGSMFITSMGSLGIPPIYHHLYDFGNVPVFCSFGAKHAENILNSDGTVETKKFIDYTFVTDERICDGHYYATAMKLMKKLFKNPFLLDTPPDSIVEDID